VVEGGRLSGHKLKLFSAGVSLAVQSRVTKIFCTKISRPKIKFGYSSHLISFSDLITSCSEDLFENAHKSNHCLHELFSSYVHRLESLRPRGHDLMLPACTGYSHKQSFIIRSLFDFF